MDAVPDNNNTMVASASQLLFYPGPLADRVPPDPFPPPGYEEALHLPALTRLRRSLTDRVPMQQRKATFQWCGSACQHGDQLVVACIPH